MELTDAAQQVQRFAGPRLTSTLGGLEAVLKDADLAVVESVLGRFSVDRDLMRGAALMKSVAGQINVVIHAAGLLASLPRILQPGERITYLSLGAGNTGRPFDLETNHRIAEFKFIQWRGGAESIRQNSLFKDFYLLAEHPSEKPKYLFIIGTGHALKFLNGGRALSSVLSRNTALARAFSARYGDRFRTVGDYYRVRQAAVTIEDMSRWFPDLASTEATVEEDAV